jgi:peptide/nickel transport system permease protein
MRSLTRASASSTASPRASSRRTLGGVLRLLRHRRRRPPLLPLIVVLLAVGLAFFGPALAPHSTIDPNLERLGQAPVPLGGSSTAYPLGTDDQGRDVLSRIMLGTRTSLAVAAVTILIGAAVGTVLGLLAGYFRGWLDILIMRAVDLTLAFPVILLALVLSVSTGPSFWTVVVVLALVIWARFARLVRGQVLSWRERDFVALAQIAGASSRRIMVTHILPNVADSVLVLASLQVGFVIIAEASLSFLGAGIPPPDPTLGGMIAGGQLYLDSMWWVSVFPGVVIGLVVFSFNIFGDWVRDTLDPKLQGWRGP